MLSAWVRAAVLVIAISTLLAKSVWSQLDEPFPAVFVLDDVYDSEESELARFLPHYGVSSSISVGAHAAGIGDVNNDGYDDIAIATPRFGASNSVILVYGSEGPHPSHSDDLKIDGVLASLVRSDTGALLGSWVSGLGDISGEDVDDFFVSTISQGCFVIFGRDSQAGDNFPDVISVNDLNGSNGFAIELAYDRGASAGDLNNDGIGDLAIGVYQANGSPRGYVLFGRNTAQDGAFPASVTENYFDGQNGFVVSTMFGGTNSVACAGDVNNDGIDDLLIGSIRFRRPDASRPNGGAFVLYGKDVFAQGEFPAIVENSYFDGDRGFAILGEDLGRALSYIGYSVSSAGDINHDGIDDLAIGSTEPVTYILYGKDSMAGAKHEPLVELTHLDEGDRFKLYAQAMSMSSVGDVNSDGIDDMVLGSPLYNSHVTSGSAIIVYGRDSTRGFTFPKESNVYYSADGNASRFSEIQLNFGREFGWSVSAAGDMNRDGINDFVVTHRDCCRTVLVYGRSASVPCRSDVDGDGFLSPSDVNAWIAAFNAMSPQCDQNGDGACSPADFSAWVSNFNAGC